MYSLAVHTEFQIAILLKYLPCLTNFVNYVIFVTWMPCDTALLVTEQLEDSALHDEEIVYCVQRYISLSY